MGQAIKCDLTGKVEEGRGAPFVDVDLGNGLRIRGTLFIKKSKEQYVQGVIGSQGAGRITDALAALKQKEKKTT